MRVEPAGILAMAFLIKDAEEAKKKDSAEYARDSKMDVDAPAPEPEPEPEVEAEGGASLGDIARGALGTGTTLGGLGLAGTGLLSDTPPTMREAITKAMQKKFTPETLGQFTPEQFTRVSEVAREQSAKLLGDAPARGARGYGRMPGGVAGLPPEGMARSILEQINAPETALPGKIRDVTQQLVPERLELEQKIKDLQGKLKSTGVPAHEAAYMRETINHHRGGLADIAKREATGIEKLRGAVKPLGNVDSAAKKQLVDALRKTSPAIQGSFAPGKWQNPLSYGKGTRAGAGAALLGSGLYATGGEDTRAVMNPALLGAAGGAGGSVGALKLLQHRADVASRLPDRPSYPGAPDATHAAEAKRTAKKLTGRTLGAWTRSVNLPRLAKRLGAGGAAAGGLYGLAKLLGGGSEE